MCYIFGDYCACYDAIGRREIDLSFSSLYVGKTWSTWMGRYLTGSLLLAEMS